MGGLLGRGGGEKGYISNYWEGPPPCPPPLVPTPMNVLKKHAGNCWLVLQAEQNCHHCKAYGYSLVRSTAELQWLEHAGTMKICSRQR